MIIPYLILLILLLPISLQSLFGYTNIDEMHDTNKISVFHNENEHTQRTLDMLNKYCLEHVNEIINGGNPVLDLVNAGLATEHFRTHTCRVVQTEKNTVDAAMANFGGLYDIDRKDKQDFLIFGEEKFRKDCLKNNNLANNEFSEDLMKNLPKDLRKTICENKVNDLKNNQTSLDKLYRLDGSNSSVPLS